MAAASSVFATLFLESPLVEEDLQVFLIGYDYEIVKNIVEYVYTGSLEFVFSNNVSIPAFDAGFEIFPFIFCLLILHCCFRRKLKHF